MGYEVSTQEMTCLMAIEVMMVIKRHWKRELNSSEVSLFLNSIISKYIQTLRGKLLKNRPIIEYWSIKYTGIKGNFKKNTLSKWGRKSGS